MSGNSRAVVLLLALLPGSAARAESPEATRTRMFHEQYERAGKAYNAQDYAAAIPALQAAFAIQPVPQILFNIAQAYRRLELYGSARVYFELYRAFDKMQSPELAELTERSIAEVDELERAKAAPKERVKVVEVEKTKLLYVQSEKPLPRWLRPLGVVSGLAGLGTLTTGVTFLGLNGGCLSPAVLPVVQCDQVYNTQTPGTALTAVGAGLLALGVVTFSLSFKRPPKPVIREEKPTPPRDTVPTLLPMLSPDDEPPPAGWGANGAQSTRN